MWARRRKKHSAPVFAHFFEAYDVSKAAHAVTNRALLKIVTEGAETIMAP